MASDLTSLASVDNPLGCPTAVSCDALPAGLGAILQQTLDKGE